MSLKELYRNRWLRFAFWAILYTAWVVWLGNYWFLLGLIIVFDLNVTKKVKWAFWTKKYKKGEKRNVLLDWLDAIIFALIAVIFINIFFFQAFKIPSSSMENSLMTGDYLFVSKLAYGPKIPQTPLTVPFTHNMMPSGKESYSTAVEWKYRRLKGFGKVERGDYVVFAFPHGDTVLARFPSEDYYTQVRIKGRQFVLDNYGPIKVRPDDKKDNYVKRCVAVPGDTLEITDGVISVNGERLPDYEGVQNTYRVVTSGQRLNSMLLDGLGVNSEDAYFNPALPGYEALPLTKKALEGIENLSAVVSVTPDIHKKGGDGSEGYLMIFPFDKSYDWTRDNFGPLWIPEKDAMVKLDLSVLPLYRRIIEVYEGHDLEVRDGRIYIDGNEADSYTFAQDYYFMVGDNRHNSSDSRYWGFVPENHIVGKPAVVWFSSDKTKPFPKNIRWNRLFKFL